MRTKPLVTILITAFTDLLGFSLILPLLPYYAATFEATPTQIGFLVGSYSAAQLIGAPILGRLSDRFGRKPVLLLSIFGTLVGFLMLGFASSLWMLFASRLLDGFTGGNISVAQAYITDVTGEKDRAKGLGLLGAAFGLGFIIGPAVGGTLSVYGYAVPAFVAAGFSLLALLGVAIFLPESLSTERIAALVQKKRQEFRLQNFWNAITRPRVGPLLQVRFFFGLAFTTLQTIFPLYALQRLGLDARSTGFVLAYVGLLLVLVQGVIVGGLANRFDEYRLIFWCSILMTISLFAWAWVPSLIFLLVVLLPIVLAGGVFNTVVNSVLSKVVNPEEIGGTLGLSSSLESLSRVIAPTMGGILLGSLGTWAPGIASGLIMTFTSVYVWRRLIRYPDQPADQHQDSAQVPVMGDHAMIGERYQEADLDKRATL